MGISGVRTTVIDLDPFRGAFGLPPSTWISDEMITNSMPIFEIIPSKPVFESGLNLFRVEDDSGTYLEMLKNHGFTTQVPIRCAFIADNFPTDSFTNEYGETFLQKFTDVASQGMSQIAQMTGSRTATEGLGKIGKFTENLGNEFGNSIVGSILKTAGSGAQSVASGLQNFSSQLKQGSGVSGVLGGGAQLVDKLLAGNRVDFPQVWRNSAFSPSYTATVRLYNPNPASKPMTKKYIIGPLAALLCLAVPRSTDGRTYNWPFFHQIKATGIYNLNPAVISNITVIKGGDQQQIAYNQALSMVDVRIDFTSLYGSILVEEGRGKFTNRPTVRSYLRALDDRDSSLSVKRNNLRRLTAAKAGAQRGTTILSQTSELEQTQLAKNEAAKKRQTPIISESEVTSRVSSQASQTEQALLVNSDPSFVTV